MWDDEWYEWRPYVSAAQRRRQSERAMQKLRKKGHPVSPVVLAGRTIAQTFWGKAWCDNLERYSDFSNRLPRGRTYVRNGAVLDLQIGTGEVQALVSGTEIYRVAVEVTAVPKARWTAICRDCAGAIDSLVELLQGRFSQGVMERMCRPQTGLFPSPREVRFSCSCPDWASMCKHVAAVLYGIGARFDEQPELLFRLRKVHERDLIANAGRAVPLSKKGAPTARILGDKDLSRLFGLEMVTGDGEGPVQSIPAPARRPGGGSARSRRAARTDHAPAEPAGTRRGPSSAARGKTDSARKPGPSRAKARRAKGSRRRRPPRAAQLEALIAEAIVDAYGEAEQRTAFYTKIDETLALPWETPVLGARAMVERIALTAAGEIVAVVRRGAKRQRIPILDLPLPQPPPAGAEWIEAYRRWARGA